MFVSDNCYQESKSITDITNATNTGVGLQTYAARSRRVVFCSTNFLPIQSRTLTVDQQCVRCRSAALSGDLQHPLPRIRERIDGGSSDPDWPQQEVLRIS